MCTGKGLMVPGPPQQERPPDLGSLRAARGQILAAASQRGLRDVRVFGSVARGEAIETSDVDLLVAPGPDTTLFDLKVGSDAHRVLARDIQFDPVTDRVLHADFMRVTDATRVRVHVPVAFTNEGLSPGIKRGGVLNVVRHDIEMYCSAGNIPQAITVDVAELDIGDSVHISMVKLPQGIRPTIAERDVSEAIDDGSEHGVEVDAWLIHWGQELKECQAAHAKPSPPPKAGTATRSNASP